MPIVVNVGVTKSPSYNPISGREKKSFSNFSVKKNIILEGLASGFADERSGRLFDAKTLLAIFFITSVAKGN